MARYLLVIFWGIAACTFLKGQDPVYSQFFAAPLQINPAFAGTTLSPRVTVNYRNQWSPYQGGYDTYSVSYEQSIESLNSGLGIMVMGDDEGNGIYSTTRFSAIYGYRVQVNRDLAIRFGIQAGLIQRRLDWDLLILPDQIDPIEGPTGPGGPLPSEDLPPDNLNRSMFDIGAGILAYGQRAYGGLSLQHLNSPDESLLEVNNNLGVGIPLRITLHGGVEIPLQTGNNRRGEAFISPNLLIMKQGEFAQVNGGAYFGLGKFFAGAWYRHTINNVDAAIALAGVRYGIFRLGYSFDFTLSRLNLQRSGGSHELSLSINFDDSAEARRRQKSARYNDCFKMFN
ncbi:MAG: type IX secretion system membrane protein PorP/SprF [Phaeodactylibacter sp.]|nr:type IX secretion system membrane protein PorP/SprF [Phaeodactylibacter sp.]MCB9273905.1 type IX secretion system membrane protein PorP/SprF [Lewinellaceae bacterium]